MKARYFVGLSVILLGVVVLGLRYNNITAYNMRARLLERDAAGEQVRDEVETALKEFVYTHMNTSMNIVLEGAYQRARAEARIAADAAVDSSIYDEAAAACDRRGHLTTDNAQCVSEYVEQRLGPAPDTNLPQRNQFSYTFYAPIWTTDLPGLALLGAIISGLIALVLYMRHWLHRTIA